MSEEQLKAKKKRKSEFAGVGALVQAAGIALMFFWFPIGIFMGLLFLLIGSSMAVYSVCSNCGNKLQNKESKVCPTCKASFN